VAPEDVRAIILGDRRLPVRPEVELLLACARSRIGPEIAERIRRLARPDLDWPLVRRLARLHGVTPLLYRSLHQTCADSVPTDVLRALADYYHWNSLRNQWLIRHLIGLLDALNAAGAPALPLKGPVLGAAAYGDPALRESCDLDILVHDRDLAAVEQLLRGRGYRSQWPWPADSPGGRFGRKHDKETVFIRDARSPQMDVHWRLSLRAFPAPPDLATVWGTARTIRLAERDLQCLGREALVRYACTHGGVHAWQYLSMVCDFAECLAACPALDWQALAEECRTCGCLRLLYVGLLVLTGTVGADLPETLLERAGSDRPAGALAARIVSDLLTRERAPNDREAPLFCLKVRERSIDRLRYGLGFVLLPGEHDWGLIRLPNRLFWIYCLLRPVRLVAQFVGLAARYMLSR
jgi:hypothetical protein